LPQRNQVSEPLVRVNPADSRNLVAAWIQDGTGFSPGPTDTLVAYSRDGGTKWKRVQVPGLTRCRGGSAITAFDPWVSFGPDGTAYWSSAVVFTTAAGPTWGEAISYSRNGGATWANASIVTIARPGTYIDSPTITADPTRPGYAYAIWDSGDLSGTIRVPFLSRTTNGGRTWSPARTPFVLPGKQQSFADKILVLTDGTLLTVFGATRPQPQFSTTHTFVGGTTVMVSRSQDAGATWTRPALVSRIPSNPSYDPNTGRGDGFSITPTAAAAGPRTSVYIAWQRTYSARSSVIVLMASGDAGLTWQSHHVIAEAAQAFQPAVAVQHDGTLGVLFYDYRNNKPGGTSAITDVWFRRSDNGGVTWSEEHLGGPFAINDAPRAVVGDYQGLAALPSSFAAVFAMAKPEAVGAPTDIFFARIRGDKEEAPRKARD
jgi:hypothetical protein